jgi:hypothetical protein
VGRNSESCGPRGRIVLRARAIPGAPAELHGLVGGASAGPCRREMATWRTDTTRVDIDTYGAIARRGWGTLRLRPAREGRWGMLRDAASKVMRVARATVFVVGITVVLALVLVAAGAAFGANGDFFKVGRSNLASAVSVLDKSGAGPALRLLVDSGAPMAVNSSARVANLNADQLDGKNQSAFADVNELGGQTAVHVFGPLPVERTFASDGGTLIVLASGSAFRSSGVADGPGRIAMNVRVDGSTRGRADGFADERGPHETLVDEYAVVEGLPAGTHTVRLEAVIDDDDCETSDETTSTICTTTNSNDFFAVTVVELSD